MGEYDALSLECRYPREIPPERMDKNWSAIPAKIGANDKRVMFYFIAGLFGIFHGSSSRIAKFEYGDDNMGGIDAEFEMRSDTARLYFYYLQHIDDDFHNVERLKFEPVYESSGREQLTFNLEMSTSSPSIDFSLSGVEPETVKDVIALANECFQETIVDPEGARKERIARIAAGVNAPAARTEERKERIMPEQDFPEGVKQLEAAIDEERNAYMEWHDGPDYSSVEMALLKLTPDEKVRAVEMLVPKLEKGYTVYLGYAVVKLGKDPSIRRLMMDALEKTLDQPIHPYSAANLARNILELGSSPKAVEVMGNIIQGVPGWYDKIEALCNMKSVLDSNKKQYPLDEIFPPVLAEIVFNAVGDDDYLVRYHAAELIMRAAGKKRDLSENKELFPLICGEHASDDEKPTAKDKAGFEKADELLRKIYENRKS